MSFREKVLELAAVLVEVLRGGDLAELLYAWAQVATGAVLVDDEAAAV